MKVSVVVFLLFSYSFASPPDGRVIGGKIAERGQFPYQISLQYCVPSCYHACGGSIISPNWIVLAAHCFSDIPTNYKALAGIVNLDDDDTIKARQFIDIEEGFVHPNFDYVDGLSFDISVAKLAQPLEFSDQVRPLKLPAPGFEADGWVVATGWGIIDGGDTWTNELLFAELVILPATVCAEINDKLLRKFNDFNATANVCTGPTGGIPAICYGDSGGPAVQDGTLIGIVSWSVNPCGHPGHPSVFLKVSTYIDFIKEHVTDL